MNLKSTLTILFIVLFGTFLQAQCNFPPSQLTCEEVQQNNAVLCNINDLDGYCTTLPDFPNPTGPNPLCQSNGGGVANNTIWFGFIAGTPSMSLSVKPENCTIVGGGNQGIQIGIYEEPCPPSGQEIVCTGSCVTTPYTLSSNNFTPGKTYYFWMDGCGGSVCDVTVDVLSGGPLVMGTIGPISGPKKVCTGGTFNYNVAPVTGGAYYHWTVNGDLQGDPTTQDESIDLTFPSAGVFQICVDVSNFCIPESAPPSPKCIDVTVTDIVPIDPKPGFVCPNATYSYNNNLYPVGEHDVTLTSWQGCDSIVKLTVNEIEVPPKDLGLIYKCLGQCITVEDKQGNGGIYCDNGVQQVVLKSWQGCDSLVNFELAIVEIEVKIDDPYELGCLTNVTPLDGAMSLAENWTNLIIKWEAFNGGKLAGPSDELITQTETGGKYCLTLIGEAPGGVSCKDSACVIVVVDPTSPMASIIGDTLSCFKDSVTLLGNSTTPNSMFTWDGPGGKKFNGKNIKVGDPGTYTLTITAANLCTDTETYEVISLKNKPDAITSGDIINCATPTKNLTGTSLTPNVTYKWYDSNKIQISNTNTVSINKIGTYIFEVTNPKNGCITLDTVMMDGDFIAPQNVSAIGDTFTCAKFPVKVDGNSTTAGVSYSWKGPNGFTSGKQTPDAPFAGVYDLVVTAPNGCKDTVMATVVADTLSPNLSTLGDTIDCFTFTGTLVASSTTPGATYAWSGPTGTGSNASFTTNMAGIYAVTVTAPNGCTKALTAEAKNDPDKPVASATVTSPLTCDSLTVTLKGISSLNLPSITYGWTGPGGFTASTQNAKVGVPGTYTLTVTNTKNGCTDDFDIDVLEDIGKPNIAAVGDTTDCITGKADLQGSSTTPNAKFQWVNSGGVDLCPTPNCQVTGAGDYTLVVTDPSNGCTDSQTVKSVADDQTPDITLSKDDDLDCLVKTVNLTTNSSFMGLVYTWSGPGVVAGDVPNISTAASGTFTVDVINPTNSCKNSASISVTQDIKTPVISASTDTIECSNNKTATITGLSDVNSNVTIAWVDQNAAPVTNMLDFNATVSQNYILTVTNNKNGCSSTLTLFVPENTTPPNVSATGDVITCFKPIVECSGNSTTSNVKYEWTGPNAYNATTPKAGNISTKGDYILTVTDLSNGCTNSQTATVTEDNQKPDLTANGGTLSCNNNSQIQLAASTSVATVSWSWSGPNNFTSNQQNPNVTASGSYTVTVTNTQNGCEEIKTAEVLSDEMPPDLSVNDAIIDCVNTSQVLNAVSQTPGVTYFWTKPDGTTSTTPDITVTQAGSYVCVVTAPNGCKTTKTSTVTLNADLPIVLAQANGEINCTNKTVDVTSNGSSTGANFNYSWTGPGSFGSTDPSFNVAMAGIYTLVITNTTNGCTNTVDVEVPINVAQPTGLVTAEKNPTCFGYTDGTFEINGVIGGTQPYLYAINGKSYSATNNFSNLGEGTYKLSIQDAAGCEFDTLITLEQPAKFTVDAGKDTIINWGTVFTLDIKSVSDYGKLAGLSWTPVLDTNCVNCPNPQFQLFDAQQFTVTAIDTAGCIATDKKIVVVKKERLVFIANTFSPNGDGLNDYFGIQVGDGVVKVSKFEIYDRWGNQLFVKSDYQPGPNPDSVTGWDGTYRGKKMNTGVFVYWAQIEFKDGESIQYKGDVTLQR